MDTDPTGADVTTPEEVVPGKAGRPPPIILTSQTNLIQLQRKLKNVVQGDFEFRSTRNETKVITKSMADFEADKSYLSNNNLSYYSFQKVTNTHKGGNSLPSFQYPCGGNFVMDW
jgi:hypothetical protein